MAKDVENALQDLTHLDWSECAVSSATGGSYLKARQGTGVDALYYKLSCYDEPNGIYGHECVNELIAARLMVTRGYSPYVFNPHLRERGSIIFQ